MIIINDTDLPEIKRGRPSPYPFDQLQPGQKLIIPGEEDIESQKNSVRTSLNYFKRKNGFIWETLVAEETGKIVVFRIN